MSSYIIITTSELAGKKAAKKSKFLSHFSSAISSFNNFYGRIILLLLNL
jgi:hypothetical protein